MGNHRDNNRPTSFPPFDKFQHLYRMWDARSISCAAENSFVCVTAQAKTKIGSLCIDFRRDVCIPLFVDYARIAIAVGLLFCNAFSGFALHAQTQRTLASPVSKSDLTAQIKNVFWQPNELRPGSPAFFTVELNRAPARVSGIWINKTLTFFKSDNPKIWYALAGADVATQPGSYDLHVTAVLTNGKRLISVKTVELTAANFQTGELEVPEKFVEPNATEQKQIARDQALKKRTFEHGTARPLWSGNFIKPVNGPAESESFGEERILNEEKMTRHLGTEFQVKEGTPVLVSNSGTVALAKELFYEGNCVVVDHGQQFFTIYMHLAKIDVKAGDRLRKGKQIGLSGASGRATGPHLHLGVRWNGAYLDPLQLLTLTLPKTGFRGTR